MGAETYLKTQQVAQALGVSVSTVKRWVDSGSIDASRTLGKHRLVSLSSVMEFARRENHPVKALDSLSKAASSFVLDDSTCELLLDLLKEGRSLEALALITAVAESDQGVVGLGDRLIRPVMEQVGNGWMVGTWDIYQEHLATQIIHSSLIHLINSWTASTVSVGRPLALGASAEGDPYLMPNLLGELVLREVGWDVRNLGGNLPLKSLAVATRDYRPGLVFLSVSHLRDRDQFVRDYSYFYESATRVGAAIILGGRGLDPELRSMLVYASFGDRMTHLAEFARKMLPGAEHR